MMKVMKVMIMMKMLKIDSSILLRFQVEPTCKERGSMVGGGWSLYTKRSCQGGGEVKQRVVYIHLCTHFLCIHFLVYLFVYLFVYLLTLELSREEERRSKEC